MVIEHEKKACAHRPGLFKLPNKKHKSGGHRTKGQLARENKGKLSVRSSGIKKNQELTKSQRKNQSRQFLKEKKHLQLINAFINGHSKKQTIYLSTIVSFDENITPESVIEKLAVDSECTIESRTCSKIYNLNVSRLKSSYTFLVPNSENIIDVIDCVKTSELVLFVWSGNELIKDNQKQLLTTLMVQGMPAILNLVAGIPPNGKQRDQMRKILEQSMISWSALKDSKIQNFNTVSDSLQVLRAISTIRKKPTILQQRHPFLLSDKIEFEDENLEENLCTLKVTGHLRGAPLNVNNLVYIQGFGDFSLSKVEIRDQTNFNEVKVLLPNEENELATENEEMEITENDNETNSTCFTDSDDEMNINVDTNNTMSSDDEGTCQQDDDEDMDDSINNLNEIDNADVDKFREERENALWPDEIDTPQDIPARERFVKYRGLKSFRTSLWDPTENLPKDYAHIFKFSDFRKTKKNVLLDVHNSFLQMQNNNLNSKKYAFPGFYTTLYIKNVPSTIKNLTNEQILTIFGLLPHEEKYSIMNMVLEKHSSCKIPIKNREKLIFKVGYRIFEAEVLFSQHNNGNKFKMERFMPAQGTFCASVFAPIMFPPATVLVFRRDAKYGLKLTASGNVLNLNPDRIVLKRVVLSGHPFKVNKRTAVVRYMFFNKEDVNWFKPVEVYTVKGRHGHIKESLGTHGLFKCYFDQPLTTQDTVLMNLYKRVFPKFTYDANLQSILNSLYFTTSKTELECSNMEC